MRWRRSTENCNRGKWFFPPSLPDISQTAGRVDWVLTVVMQRSRAYLLRKNSSTDTLRVIFANFTALKLSQIQREILLFFSPLHSIFCAAGTASLISQRWAEAYLCLREANGTLQKQAFYVLKGLILKFKVESMSSFMKWHWGEMTWLSVIIWSLKFLCLLLKIELDRLLQNDLLATTTGRNTRHRDSRSRVLERVKTFFCEQPSFFPRQSSCTWTGAAFWPFHR